MTDATQATPATDELDECERCDRRVPWRKLKQSCPPRNQMICPACYRREIESFGVPEMLWELDMEDDE